MACAAVAPFHLSPYSGRNRCRFSGLSDPAKKHAGSARASSTPSTSFSSRLSKASSDWFGSNTSYKLKVMDSTHENVNLPKGTINSDEGPDHLVVLVHGILASPGDWTYAEAELKRQLGSNFFIYVSSSNTYRKTFDGIDGAGKRLADEVIQVVQKLESLKKISFLAHSLGGLFARYAIGVLYCSTASDSCSQEVPSSSQNGNTDSKFGKIVGLEPINFITLATPHLGVKGKNQLPFLFGVPLLEKLAAPIAPFIVGQTGRQLFLADGKPGRSPLLLRMTYDCQEQKFMSALGSFRWRILYANVSFDHMVGWRTSSIRRETELVKPPRRSLEGYKHVVDVEYCSPVLSETPYFPPKAKEATKVAPNPENTKAYYDIIEEEMIRCLQRVGWKKVDVSFHSAPWPFFAHNNIHVKSEWLNNAGAGVIAHVAHSLKQQESRTSLPANL